MGKATRDVGLDEWLLPLPGDTVWRVGQLVTEFAAFMAVVGEGVAMADVAGVVTADEQVTFGDGKGLLIDLLAVECHNGFRMRLLDERLGHGEHATRAAAQVVDALDDARLLQPLLFAGQQEAPHQLHHIAGREMLSRRLIGLLVGDANQLFEQQAHAVVVVAVRPELFAGDGVHQVPQAGHCAPV